MLSFKFNYELYKNRDRLADVRARQVQVKLYGIDRKVNVFQMELIANTNESNFDWVTASLGTPPKIREHFVEFLRLYTGCTTHMFFIPVGMWLSLSFFLSFLFDLIHNRVARCVSSLNRDWKQIQDQWSYLDSFEYKYVVGAWMCVCVCLRN